MISHFFAYLFSFVSLWFGSKLVTSSLVKLARSWRLPLFTISFFILGILTSLPEASIGVSSLINSDPTVFAGNFLGGVIVLFLLVIPMLAVVSGGVKIPKTLSQSQIVLTLIVVLAPSLLTADQEIGVWEGVLLILLYFILFLFLLKKKSFLEKVSSSFVKKKVDILPTFLSIIVGVVILFAASYQVVQSTLYFAQVFEIAPFFVSLIVISLGSNIPEMTIILRSFFEKNTELALADYMGSAAANTLLFGIFTILYGQPVILPNHFFLRFFFILLGLVLFFFFARSKNTFSRAEAFVLLCCYVIFIVTEILILQ